MNSIPSSVSIRVHPWFLVLLVLVAPGPASAAEPAAQRPFMLWTRAEAEAIAARVRTEPWAKARMDALLAAYPTPTNRPCLDNFFLHLVAGDKDAAAFEGQVLKHLGILWESPDYEEGRSTDIGGVGAAANYDMGIRYDLFRDVLTPAEQRVMESRFNMYVAGHLRGGGKPLPLDAGWEHPRALYASLTAAASLDRRLIEAAFHGPQGPKAYFDHMADGWLSPSGCTPAPNAIGAMWLWCRAVERLGLDSYGFGYTGAGGGSMRRLMEGYALVGDPRIEIPGGTPFYGQSALTLAPRLHRGFFDVTTVMGSSRGAAAQGGAGSPGFALEPLRHPRDVFRAPFVVGRLRDGNGGWPPTLPVRSASFYSYDKTPRDLVGRPQIQYKTGFDPMSLGLQLPLALELAHQRWPDAGFDYFLARSVPPGEDAYLPSLYWGLNPIPCSRPKPPPVRSVVLPTLGMALLRAEEGSGFWESPAPYAVLRLAEGRNADEAPSALSLHAFHAFNRPLYRHEPAPPVPEAARAGLHHNTVVVDGAARFGTGRGSARQRFDPVVKFVAVRSTPYSYEDWVPGEKALTSNRVTKVSGARPGVAMERALALTREYLVDCFALAGDAEHTYHWVLHAPGSARMDRPDAWQATERLNETLGYGQTTRITDVYPPIVYTLKSGLCDQREFDPKDAAWSVNLVQTTTAANPSNTLLGAEWYGRNVGSRVTFLGEPGTTAFVTRGMAGRQLTAEESARLQGILQPRQLPTRDARYDKADSEITEIAIPPAGPPRAAAPAADDRRDLKIVGQPVAPALPETGGVTLIARRRAARTLFVALHEPFEKLAWRLDEFRRIAQTEDAVAVAIRGRGVDDRVLVRLGERAGESLTLSDGRERFEFAGFACVRIGPDAVTVAGDLTAMELSVTNAPALVVNGEKAPASVRDGRLVYRR